MNARALAAGLVLVSSVALGPARADAVNIVEVFNNVFTPQRITVAKGETITWVMRDGGHTVTADDGRFSFPEEGTSARGDTFAWTFTDDETFSYRCLVHGPAMSGVVVVGVGSPPPPSPPESPHRIVPSAEYPTLGRALVDAEPTTIIDVQPGTYHYGVIVATPDVTIRGGGPSPADVVFDGDEQRAIGIDVRADGVRIENLTVRDHGLVGVSYDSVTRFAADHVVVTDNGSYGIRARASNHGAIRGLTASGSSVAAVAVQDCDTCDIDIDGVEVRASAVGVLIERAGSVILRRSSIIANGTGVVLTGGLLEQRGAHLWGNTISDNVAAAVPRSNRPVGLGIWIDGGSNDLLEDNVVTGHRYGIVVTGLAGPSLMNRIVGNTIEGSSIADVAWDGVGLDVCFTGNRTRGGSASSSAPPMAESLYPCASPHTVGVPWPTIWADLLS